ncbi:hypothetical protein HMPREF0783_0013, partial [Staphylococcus aureus subsp. aureus ATCC BAA-39]
IAYLFSHITDRVKRTTNDAVFYPVFCLMNKVNYEIIFEENNKVEMDFHILFSSGFYL